MNNSESIFRSEALQRYLKSRDEAVLPQFIQPRIRLILWLFITLLLTVCTIVWFVQIPVYTTGSSVVIESDNGLELLVFVPANNPSVAVEDIVWLTSSNGQRIKQSVTTVMSEPQSPQAIYTYYPQYKNSLANIVTQPSWVIRTSFLGDETNLGSQYLVEVETGTQRIIANFPFIGQLFQG